MTLKLLNLYTVRYTVIVDMQGFVVVFFIVLVIFIVGAVQNGRLRNFRQEQIIDMNDTLSKFKAFFQKLGFSAVLLFLALIFIFKSILIVPAGATGVYELFGRVKDEELQSGFHLVNPFGRVTKMSIRTQEYTMSVASNEGQITGDDSITALTNEGLEVKLDITVLYHLDELKASDIYKMVGLDFVNTVIRPSIRSVIREEVAKFSAKEIYSEKREQLSANIADQLGTDMGVRGLILEEVLLRNVELPSRLTQSIQDKLTAEQEAQRYDFVLDKEKKEAERKRIEAEGQRDSQTIINQSLSAEYLEYLYITSLKDRQGTIYVPTNPENGLPLFRGVE